MCEEEGTGGGGEVDAFRLVQYICCLDQTIEYRTFIPS